MESHVAQSIELELNIVCVVFSGKGKIPKIPYVDYGPGN